LFDWKVRNAERLTVIYRDKWLIREQNATKRTQNPSPLVSLDKDLDFVRKDLGKQADRMQLG
jgi:hypothetical protein